MIGTRKDLFTFRGAHAPPAVGSRQGIWCSKITAAGGTPVVKSVSGGTMDLALEATNEVQNICLYFGDILAYKVEDLIRAEFIMKLTAAFPAACSLAFGMAAARNDALASVAAKAWFRIAGGSQAVLLDSLDGTITNTGIATGQTLTTTLKRFAIDFTGVQTRQVPQSSIGNRANVTFHMDDSRGLLRRVGDGTLFDISNYATGSGLQPFFQLQKTAATSVATLSVESVEVEYRVR